MSQMTPQEIVHELDKHIIGQINAKRAVAIALRNRWRRQQIADPLRQEITPKNILMIGPTGVGKPKLPAAWPNWPMHPLLKLKRLNLLRLAMSDVMLTQLFATWLNPQLNKGVSKKYEK